MEDQSLETLVNERVAQLEAISQHRNALLHQMFHMVHRRQTVGSIIKLEDEEGDDELAAFLDRFDLAKNPDTGSIQYFNQSDLISAPSPAIPSPRPPSPPRRSSEPHVSEPSEHLSPQTQNASSPSSPAAEKPRSEPVSRANSVSILVPSSPAPESDDELDLIGTPVRSAPSAHTQSRASSEPVHVVRQPSEEKFIVVERDDSTEGEQIVLVGDTTDEEDPVHITHPLEQGSAQVPIVVDLLEDAIAQVPPEAPSSSEDDVDVQDIPAEEATKTDVALPEADKLPAEPDDVRVEEDLFSVQDELTPPPATEPEPTVDSPEPLVAPADNIQDVVVEGAEDVAMGGDLLVQAEELKDRLEPANDLPAETVRAETPLSDTESMVIDEEDDETQPEPPPVLRVDDPPAVAPALDVEPPGQESTAQPTATTVPALPILIPEPVSTFGPPVVLDFSTVSPQQASPEPPATPSDSQHGYRLTYTLPPLKVLPADFSRKTKTGKQQRKHKERDKGGDKAKEKDDWTPLGVSRWGAMLRANPVYPKVSRAPKCLSTREWSVAMAELRLMRALEQVESLKDSGRWSFRQPKKQRGVGGLTKTHWDHVLDEMKWMRTDFREERKWKLALAYHISTAVLEWHCFSSLAERVEKGICVGWRPPRDDGIEEELMLVDEVSPVEEKPTTDVIMEDSSALTKISAHSGSLLGVDYGSDDDDDDEQEKQSVIDALEPSSVLDDALDAAGKGPDTVMSDSGFENIEFKRAEDSEEPHSAPREATSEMDVDEEGDSEKPSAIKMEETEDQGVGEQETQPSGLKDSSSDPTLSQTDSLGTIGEPSVSTTPAIKSSSKTNIYAPLREYLAYSDPDKSFIDIHDLDRVIVNASADELSADLAFPPADLSKIFPDLPPMGMLDVAPPPTANVSEGRTKKSEKRADRDDPNKRVEETMYTKLFPIGRFMYTKPTLIGPLQPAKRWKDGQWLPADDCPALDPDTPIVKVQDSLSDLFNPKFANPPKSLEQLKEKEAKETPKRVSSYMWTAVDDSLLKSLADKYPNNWSLISECYNSARVRISTDKRTARDCQERWKERFALELTPKPLEATLIHTDEPQGTPLPPPTPSMTTRGIKRLASASVSGPPPVASGSDAKKRRRHQYLVECIRKAGKKRSEQAQKMLNNQRKPPATHETHAQYTRLPKYSPAELSRLKAEKEYKDQQDLIAARRKHEEITRAQQQRLQTAQPTQGQAASAPQGQSQAAPPAPTQQQQAAQVVQAMQAQHQTGAPATQQPPTQTQNPIQVLQQQQQQQLQQLQAAVAQQQRLTATAVAAARGQVNISQQQQQQHQQQRIASPLAGNPRLPLTQQQQQHQLLQHRLAAQQALLHQQQALAAQAAAGSSTGANNAVVNGVRPGTSSPRPPASVPAAPGNALQRQYLNMNMNMVQNLQATNMVQNLQATGYTSEQLQQMLQIAHNQQQQQQQQQR